MTLTSLDEIRNFLEWSLEYLSSYPKFFSDSDRAGYECKIEEVQKLYVKYQRDRSVWTAHDFAALKKLKARETLISTLAFNIYSDIQYVVYRNQEFEQTDSQDT